MDPTRSPRRSGAAEIATAGSSRTAARSHLAMVERTVVETVNKTAPPDIGLVSTPEGPDGV